MSIYEVAKKAGVSIATVSRVINNNPGVRPETRERVKEALKDLNYRPNAIARSLAVNATYTIGVLASDVRDSYFANAIYTIEQTFQEYGYHVVLCNTGGELEQRKSYLGLLLEKKVDGIVLVGSVFKEKSGNQHIFNTAKSVPVVMLNGYLQGENIYSVVCDDKYAVETIVKDLYYKGRRNIVYVYDVDSFSGLSKLDGFKSGMKEVGLTAVPKAIVKATPGLQGGIRSLNKLDDANIKYDAVIASEDIIAAGILKGLAQRGMRVPEDVCVFGYNNSIISKCTSPELSTVENKVVDLAEKSVNILYGVLKGKEIQQKLVVKPGLIYRESCP